MISKINKLCTGCGSCLNVCPVCAISFSYEQNNFYQPVVDEQKCIRCNKCISVCPAINYKSSNTNIPKTYAISANDDIRRKSTSGGAFGVIAEYILNNGGYICGAAWDKYWNVKHIIINDIKDLDKLRFSKYVQSYIGFCFKEIKNLLDKNKIVLFSGTPCQNAGLLSFLGKNYDNLYTIDLLCHGNPAPKIWHEYLKENYDINQITNINFRSKKLGWVQGCSHWQYNSDIAFIETNNKDRKCIGVYYEAFLKHILSNESCIDCKYKYIPRPADFTLGDFWSFNKYDSKLNDGKGLSIVCLNNEKAKKLFDKIKNNFRLIKQINLHKKWQHLEITNRPRKNIQREKFFNQYNKNHKVTKSLNAMLQKHYDIGLLSFFNGLNYGSALVAYSVYKIIEDLGYSVLMINKKWCGAELNKTNKSFQFALKHYDNISKVYNHKDDHRELNNLVDTFVVGGDTLWWWSDVSFTENYFWLDFAQSNKKKISFCTSMAQDNIDHPLEKRNTFKYLYSRFDAISVRDSSAVDNLKNIYNVSAKLLLDPTLIANKEIFEDLVKESKKTDKKYLVAYILDTTLEKVKAIKYLADKLKLKLVFIPGMYYHYSRDKKKSKNHKNILIEDFVYYFKNADFVVTDSFHGTCFSIIFEKQFLSIYNNKRGSARYKVFEEFNLKDKFINNYNQIYTKEDFIKSINYKEIKKYLAAKSDEAKNWLKQTLDNPNVKTKDDLFYDYIIDLKQSLYQKSNIKKENKNLKFYLRKVYRKGKAIVNRYKINKIIEK